MAEEVHPVDLDQRQVDIDKEMRSIVAQNAKREVPYAPPSADPIKVASVMVKSVHVIGSQTAKEINEAADDIVKGAEEVAQSLRDLAAAISRESDRASLVMEQFAGRATSTLERVREVTKQFQEPQTEPHQ